MSGQTRVLVQHSAECDEQVAKYGWPDRWMAEWLGTTFESRDRLGRRHRHGERWDVWRCSGLTDCPAKAVVRQRGMRVVVSLLIDGESSR